MVMLWLSLAGLVGLAVGGLMTRALRWRRHRRALAAHPSNWRPGPADDVGALAVHAHRWTELDEVQFARFAAQYRP